MHVPALGRSLALLLVIALLAAACSSSESNGAGAEPSADESDSADGSVDAEGVAGGAINPANVEQLGLSLTGSAMTADDISCILGRAEDDGTLTDVLTGVEDPGYQFGDETFTALAVAMHACIPTEVLAASLLSLIHISEPTRRTIPSRMPSSA